MEFKITKLLAPLLFLALPALVQAQLIFTTNSGAITVTGYNGPAGAVVIPATTNGYPVTGIGDYAFAYSSLTSVTVPNSVTNIWDSAFLSCTNLANISVDASNPVYSSLNGVLFDKTHVTLLQLPGGLGGSYAIPDSVTDIEYQAFYGCTRLTSVTIPNSVTRIELGFAPYFFPHCANLTNITVEASNPVYSSLDGALLDKPQETLYRFPGGLGGSYAIPASVVSIMGFAFFECAGLTNVTIPNSVSNIGDGAFAYSGLTSVTIPNSVTLIGSGNFYDCANLTNITVEASNPVYSSLSGVLFDKAQVTLLLFPRGLGGGYAIPNSVANIGYGAFEFTGLASVTIPGGVTNIEDYAFFESTGLTSVTIPDGVTRLGYHAFEGCSNLASVTIPDSVTTIEHWAFSECTGLTSVAIPNSVTNIDYDALYGCANLTNITVDASNSVYSSLNGVLFDKAKVTLLQFPIGLGGSYAIPNSVTNIGHGAFSQCTGLTGVTIPNGVTSIQDDAFSQCTGLTSVTIPNSVARIGYRAFSECASLKTAYFQGNAPPDNGNAFDVARAVVYYLPGTTGWGSTFGGVPAVLWNPQAKTLGFTGGLFGFKLTGPVGAVVVVEGCTNLSNPVWLTLATNTIPGSGTSTFSDSESASLASRLYRFRLP